MHRRAAVASQTMGKRDVGRMINQRGSKGCDTRQHSYSSRHQQVWQEEKDRSFTWEVYREAHLKDVVLHARYTLVTLDD